MIGRNVGPRVSAIDPDEGDTLTYSLGGSSTSTRTDAASFDISTSTGQLMTKVALDYENPADADGDNMYMVEVIGHRRRRRIRQHHGDDRGDGTKASADEAHGYDANENNKVDLPELLEALDDLLRRRNHPDAAISDVIRLYSRDSS